MMRRGSYILLLSTIGLLFGASPSKAQVIATNARITVIVIPPAGITFDSAKTLNNQLQIQQTDERAMRVRASSNVAVFLDSLGGRTLLNINDLSRGTTRILTENTLRGVSKVEAIFLGN